MSSSSASPSLHRAGQQEHAGDDTVDTTATNLCEMTPLTPQLAASSSHSGEGGLHVHVDDHHDSDEHDDDDDTNSLLSESQLRAAEGGQVSAFLAVLKSKLHHMSTTQIVFIIVLMALMMAGNAVQLIGLNYWLRSFPGGGHAGSYTILTLSSLIFAAVFAIGLIGYAFWVRPDMHFAMDRRGWVLLFGIGLVDTLNSFMNIYAANHTPEVLQALFQSLLPIFTCLLTKAILSDPRSYRNYWIYISFGLTIVGVIVAAVPNMMVGDDEEGESSSSSGSGGDAVGSGTAPTVALGGIQHNTALLWSLVFCFSVPFAALMNVWQTKYMEDYTEAELDVLDRLEAGAIGLDGRCVRCDGAEVAGMSTSSSSSSSASASSGSSPLKSSLKSRQQQRHRPIRQCHDHSHSAAINAANGDHQQHHASLTHFVAGEKFAGAVDEQHHTTAVHGILWNTRRRPREEEGGGDSNSHSSTSNNHHHHGDCADATANSSTSPTPATASVLLGDASPSSSATVLPTSSLTLLPHAESTASLGDDAADVADHHGSTTGVAEEEGVAAAMMHSSGGGGGALGDSADSPSNEKLRKKVSFKTPPPQNIITISDNDDDGERQHLIHTNGRKAKTRRRPSSLSSAWSSFFSSSSLFGGGGPSPPLSSFNASSSAAAERHRPFRGEDTIVKLVMLCGGTLTQAILALLLLPADALPWWGGAGTVADAVDNFTTNAMFVFTNRANAMGSLFYSSGFIFTYIGSAYLNQYSPTLCSMVGQLSSPMTALVLVLVPQWNLEAGSGEWYWSVAAVVLLMAATVVYSAWEEMTTQEMAYAKEREAVYRLEGERRREREARRLQRQRRGSSEEGALQGNGSGGGERSGGGGAVGAAVPNYNSISSDERR